MSIQERKARHRQSLRNGILGAAREIAREDGWAGVTIRKIAALVEYSPPVIYEHFESKDEILLELVRQGYAEQLAAVKRAARSARGPEEAVLEIGRAWVGFAFESPDLYQVMYGLGGVSFPLAELEREGQKIAEAIGPVVEQFLAESGQPVDAVETKVIAMWATAHGVVSLAMAGRLASSPESTRGLLDRAVSDYLDAWRQGGRR